jgi:hypothetical protein
VSRQQWEADGVVGFLVLSLLTRVAALLFVLLAMATIAVAADRPKISVAVGVGASFERSGLAPARTDTVPTFFAVGGFGDGILGIDLGLTATTASGRFRAPDAPVDRLGADAMLVVRPWAIWSADIEALSFSRSLLRTIAAEAGLGYEHDSRGVRAGGRTGARLGARVDVPLFPRDPSQLRVRFAVRRFIGFYVPQVDATEVKDTGLEAYGALAVSF